MINYYRAVFRRWRSPRFIERIRRIILDVPTLMIWGEQDTALGKELTVGTDRLVRNLSMHYLPNASHWVQQDAPAEVNAILEAWLGR
jgi:pimeloyl-ACP methyl ester carboxylesterase